MKMRKKKAEDMENDSSQPVKKRNLFSAKEFRKQLNTSGLNSLQQFLQVIKESDGHDYIFDYLEAGGSCLELIHSLEVDATIPPTIVFEIITFVLLKINTLYPQYQSAAYEACRYILNNYVMVLNKMINLSSTTPERKSCLKLLTAMVTFSSILAKDILIHVNFHSTNVELLTKHTGEKDSTRDNFIKFLTAYLVDGHYPALSVLLEKKGFFTSIITGLKFDSVDTLCLVISAMKTFILENSAVSKTAKMKTFNTIVVRDIVNLYNWKGPAGFRAQNKKNMSITVDEIEKSKVNESVHDFLLVLCTNHKSGIIFKDHLVGLGKKNQNGLMYTVLESLERPWEHSYASELVIKICGACPDLAKTLWGNLKSFLEPRLSQKWVNAMKFAVNLIKQLQPNCIEYCAKELSDIQLFQIVQCLVLPLPILKTILSESNSYESAAVKQHILVLLLEMLRALQRYVIASEKWFGLEKQNMLELLLRKHISKNFPDALKVLNGWEMSDENSPYSIIQMLEIIFDIFNQYKGLAPDLLETLGSSGAELTDLLTKVEQLNETDESLDNLQVKIINVFVDLNQTNFTADSKMFMFVVPVLLKIYYNQTDAATLDVLHKLFKNTGIFDGCLYEINIWINGILDLKKFDKSMANDVVSILNVTNRNILQFLDELSLVQSETGRQKHYSDIVQNLMLQTDILTVPKQTIKHRYLSPMILGLLSYMSSSEISKSLKIYINFVMVNLLHLQTQIKPLVNFVDKSETLPASFKKYAVSWVECEEIVTLKKSKGRLHIFQAFSEQFLSGDLVNFLETNNLNVYSDLKLNLVDMGMFYLTNLLNNGLLTPDIADGFEKFVKSIIKTNISDSQKIERVLCHPVLVYSTNFLDINKENSQGYAIKFLINITKYVLEEHCNIEIYLNVYREKLLNSVLKILSKPEECDQISLNLKTIFEIYGLGYNECLSILVNVSQSHRKYSEHEIIVDILSYSLKQFTHLCIADLKLEPLSEDVIVGLTDYFVFLSKNQQNVSALSLAFLGYLKKHPHVLSYININLFKALLELEELHKDNVQLSSFLLDKNISYVKYVRKHLHRICEKKALLLPLLTVLCKHELDETLIQQIYDLIVTSLNKTIQKPQKVGQHFHENYQGLVTLINVAMPVENCKTFWEKVQKFDGTEVFHVHLLKAICLKASGDSVTSKEINSIIMTFVHLQINMFKKSLKSESEISKATEVASVFVDILRTIKPKIKDTDLKNTANNETVKLYFKFCLKYGVSNQPVFLQALRILIEILDSFLAAEDGRLILDMLTSHSEFLETVLGEYSITKMEILSLYLVLCKTFPEFMEKHYVPLLLASYRALVNKCDRTILLLLKMYESKPEQTHFYDFKPFLWGRVAATHYSVRQQLENALWRQPKMGDVLDILQENLVHSTITHYRLRENLRSNEGDISNIDDTECYDLTFLLPLFSQLLAPEQQVQTYKFTRSGALSLTVIGLSSTDKETRQAACHVLARLHYHVDARQTGKDNLLWIRYIEAVCKGTALLPDFKLNNFAAIYLARMALILTQPNLVMYLPLSQHLTAKSSLDFSTVPELYTFLHSSDVNFKEHRNFTLELLRDGLRTEKDFTDFVRSMAFKLFSELYSSALADVDTRLLILDVVKAICEIPLGVRVLCENYSFLTQLSNDFNSILKDGTKWKNHTLVVKKNLEIISKTLKVMQDRHTCFMIYGVVRSLIFSNVYRSLVGDSEGILFEILVVLQNKFSGMFSKEFCSILLNKVDDPICRYLDKYGCDFFNINDTSCEDKYFNLRIFIMNFKKQNSS